MKKFFKIIQFACLCGVVFIGETLTQDIVLIAIIIVHGVAAYAEGLFHE